MSLFDNLSTTQKRLASVSGIIVALTIIISTCASAFGLDTTDFYIATSNDVNKTHLRIAQQSQYSYEKELERLEERKMQNWTHQYQLESNGSAVPPQIKQQELDLEKRINEHNEQLKKLDAEIEQRQG